MPEQRAKIAWGEVAVTAAIVACVFGVAFLTPVGRRALLWVSNIKEERGE